MAVEPTAAAAPIAAALRAGVAGVETLGASSVGDDDPRWRRPGRRVLAAWAWATAAGRAAAGRAVAGRALAPPAVTRLRHLPGVLRHGRRIHRRDTVNLGARDPARHVGDDERGRRGRGVLKGLAVGATWAGRGGGALVHPAQLAGAPGAGGGRRGHGGRGGAWGRAVDAGAGAAAGGGVVWAGARLGGSLR